MDTVVKPKVVRLSLTDGQYIDVKRRLNTGEQQDLFAVMAPTQTPGERAKLETKAVMTATVLAYLIAWSLMDDGQPLPMSPDMPETARLAVLRSLDPDVFREIQQAIDAHVEAVDLEIAEAKKTKGGASASSTSSPSPDVAIGAMSGSVN